MPDVSGIKRLKGAKIQSRVTPPGFCSGARRATQSSKIERTDRGYGGGGGKCTSLSGPKPGKKSKY